MLKKVYIQSLNGLPIDDWAFTAYLGFKARGCTIIFFDDIQEVPVNKNTIVIANIDDTLWYFKQLGVELPLPLNIPPDIKKYAARETSEMTLKNFKESTGVPVFVKPLHKMTAFPAGVITKMASLKELFYGISDDTAVMVSEYREIISEWRGFVINGSLQALHWYAGSFKNIPDVSLMEAAIRSFHSAPAGYSIDFGITADRKSILIECNDGWSLGSYGCDPKIYCNLLINRWAEIVKF